jgi:hypothetical protein
LVSSFAATQAKETSIGVFSEGKPIAATRVGNRWVLAQEVNGTAAFEVRYAVSLRMDI